MRKDRGKAIAIVIKTHLNDADAERMNPAITTTIAKIPKKNDHPRKAADSKRSASKTIKTLLYHE